MTKINSNRLPTATSESKAGGSLVSADAPVPVTDAVSAGAVNPDNDKNVLEVGSDVFGAEWLCSRLLENNCYNIIPNVPLP